ncbi:hypothetical protein QFZ55_002927 [Streptomyces luteogriseus]|nr:hypothetical protein [Streptomyces luteogriseus]
MTLLCVCRHPFTTMLNKGVTARSQAASVENVPVRRLCGK